MSWVLPEEPAALLALATDYPYAAPTNSYLFIAGEARPLAAEPARFAGRVPVVAHGSNRSPAQLARKFGLEAEIPVAYGWLEGYDVVYAAHVARYGAVTSTLAAVPGCRVRVAVTWLTPEQLTFMHQTERMNYSYGRLPAGAFRPEAGPAPEVLTVYVGNHGPLVLDGTLVGLAAIDAQGRPHCALLQRELQLLLAERHHPGELLDSLLLARIAELERRLAFQTLLQSLPGALTGFEVLERLDGLIA